jgi:hypothetical protein
MAEALFSKPSLITRIAVGKAVGTIIGLIGFVLLPVLWPESDPMLRWGILFWYATMGAIIAVYGVFNYHPVLRLPLPWWVRAPIIGAWMNFVLVFFAYDLMEAAIQGMLGIALSPFWFVVEGAIAGAVIGGLATKFGGEGKEAAGR